MKSRQFRIRPDQEAACVELHPDVPAADAVRLVLQRGIHAERRSPFELAGVEPTQRGGRPASPPVNAWLNCGPDPLVVPPPPPFVGLRALLAPQSPQERPEPEGVSAHGRGRQDGLAGLSLAVEVPHEAP